MLARKFILTGETEFARVKQEGRVIQSESFGTSFIKKEGLSKFGFIVSNKISNSAVARNRIKRALKEAVRQTIDEKGRGLTVVFFAKPQALRRSNEEIANEVKRVLAKII